MDLDIRTLSFMATLSNFLMFLALFTLWWVNRDEKATFHWMAGAFLMGVGFLLIGLRHMVPPMLSVVIANLSILAGYFLQYRGIYVFLGKSANPFFGAGLFAVVGAGFVYFTFVEPDVLMRIVLISWAVSLIALLAALALVHEMKHGFSVPETFVAVIFVLYSTFMLARGAYAFYEGEIADFMSAGTIHAVSLIVIVALSISLSIGYSVMVTVRLNRLLVHEIDVRNRFFSIIAHDLRSPFTALNGFTSQFRRLAETKSRDELIVYAESINNSSTQVLRLVENLLDWSRTQLSSRKTEAETLKVRDIVDRAFDPMMPAAQTKRLSVDIRVEDETVHADPEMLATVLRNLFDNAIKFSEPGGTITVVAQQSGERTEIAMQDTGRGIDRDIRSTLFDVGTKTSTKGTAGEKGSGLGLPLCRELLRENNGSIRIDDARTRGTRFVVTLPSGG